MTETATHPRCPEHGVLLQSEGWCWYGKHTSEEDEMYPQAGQTDNVQELYGDDGEVVDMRTQKTQQPTLDDTIFAPYEVHTVRVNFSGAAEIPVDRLVEDVDPEPGAEVEVRLTGYIVGAKMKWKPGGDDQEASVNIALTELLEIGVGE